MRNSCEGRRPNCSHIRLTALTIHIVTKVLAACHGRQLRILMDFHGDEQVWNQAARTYTLEYCQSYTFRKR